MDEWAEFERDLVQWSSTGGVEVHEDGEWLAELSGLHWELRREGKHPLIHLWSEDRNLVRRVLRVARRDPERLVLEVQRFGRSKPGRLEFARTEGLRGGPRVSREKFRSRFRRMLEGCFPDARLRSLTTAADLEHSFSGVYSRGLLAEGPRDWAVIGISASESGAAIDGLLTFGLLWLDWTRQHAERRAVEGLRVFLPEGSGRTAAHRARALDRSANLEVYVFSERSWRARRLDPQDAGNLESWLMPRHDVEATLLVARAGLDRIRSLAAEDGDAMDLVVPPGTRDVAVRFRGLEFACWSQGRVEFGLSGERHVLTDATWPALEKLLRQLFRHRNPLAENTNHPLFRAAPERWLETMVLADPSGLDVQLDPRFLYSQVPAFSAGDRAVIDVLGVTRQGRLAVIELKASEDLQLPMQAVDYWLRVCRHHREGDFARYGYFPGIELDRRPPLLWLVAPGLQFHPTTDVLLKHFSSEVQVARIGLNENWRRGLRVVFRM